MQYGMENECKIDFELVEDQHTRKKHQLKTLDIFILWFWHFCHNGVYHSILLLDKYDFHIKKNTSEYILVHNSAILTQKIPW